MPGFLARFKRHLIVFLAVLGPGFITAMVDNDSGGIYTYSRGGGALGLSAAVDAAADYAGALIVSG